MGSVLFSFVFLVMAASISIPLILSAKWNVELMKRNRLARLHNNLEFIKRLRNVRMIEFVIDLAQLALLVIVIFMKLSLLEWIGVGLVFTISVVARLNLNRAKRLLLTEGQNSMS